VLFELVADNASMARAMFMAVHLANTFLLLGALTITAHWVSGGAPVQLDGRRGRAALVMLLLAGVLAAGVSGAVAALGDTLFPAKTLAEAMALDLSSTSHALLRLRVLHPMLAVVAGVLVVAVAPRISSDRERRGAIHAGNVAAALAAVQLALGFVNVLLLAPVWMQLVHLLTADALWISLVLLGATALASEATDSRAARESVPAGREAATVPAAAAKAVPCRVPSGKRRRLDTFVQFTKSVVRSAP
jgi:heme A synthase